MSKGHTRYCGLVVHLAGITLLILMLSLGLRTNVLYKQVYFQLVRNKLLSNLGLELLAHKNVKETCRHLSTDEANFSWPLKKRDTCCHGNIFTG